MKPIRLMLAQKLCRHLPPLVAQRARSYIYPQKQALSDDYQFTTRSQTGSWLKFRTSDFHGGWPFSVHGYNEWRNLAIAATLASKGDTIIEIGANIGTEAIGFADIVGDNGKVYAFEPLPSNLEALNEAVRLNNKTNLTVYPVAVSDENKQVRFDVPPRHLTGEGFIQRGQENSKHETVTVGCVALDSLAAQLGSARFIFIDVEGEEVRVLRGAREYIRKFQPVIVLEAAPRCLERSGFTLHDLHAEIESLGYEPYKVALLGLEKAEITGSTHLCNYVCVPGGQSEAVKLINNYLRKCALLPCFPGVNPISKVL